MCNHYRNAPEALSTWRDYIGWDLFDPLPAPDLWPRRPALVVCNGGAGKVPAVMTWGVPLTLPGKRPGTTVTKHVTNVRNLASPFWRAMLNDPAQRCLVPFTSFAEPRPGGGRDEVWFAAPGTPLTAFAGIWRADDQGPVFAFLTCDPNPLVAPVHPKAMPVILAPEDHDRWLSGAPAEDLAVPFPSQLMVVEE